MFYNYKKLIAEIPDETHAAKFLQKVGIIHNERFCCGVQMRPIEEKKREKLIPSWRCISCHRRKGIRTDTWLDLKLHSIPLLNLFIGGRARIPLLNFVKGNLG